MFEKIKDYFQKGLWDIVRMRSVVGKVITEAEYALITGEDYDEIRKPE